MVFNVWWGDRLLGIVNEASPNEAWIAADRRYNPRGGHRHLRVEPCETARITRCRACGTQLTKH